MPENSQELHEARELLSNDILDRHRAIASMMEEMEAVDWYDQRVQACTDPELKRILEHNRDEEKEHAAMVIEWLRRNDARFEQELRERLFTTGPIVSADHDGDHDHDGEEHGAPAPDGSLGIGSLAPTTPPQNETQETP